jgi:sugar lactone lactonase YvrE
MAAAEPSKTATPDLEVVLDLGMEIGEGPIWDAETATLVFVDSERGRIFLFDPATNALRQIEVGVVIGAAIPRRSGGFAVSSVDGLLSVDDMGAKTLIAPIERDRASRMNDAKCDSRGRMLSGTFSTTFERGAGALYKIEPDLSVAPLVGDISVSNGIAWGPDETRLYYVDTRARGVELFDYDINTGAVSNHRRFVDIDRVHGVPDGITVDAEGYVWVALYLGGAVRRYAPDGTLDKIIALPVSGVTSCNFAGPFLQDLYITTARFGVAPDVLAREPHAGALFRCRPGVTGLPSHKFAG